MPNCDATTINSNDVENYRHFAVDKDHNVLYFCDRNPYISGMFCYSSDLTNSPGTWRGQWSLKNLSNPIAQIPRRRNSTRDWPSFDGLNLLADHRPSSVLRWKFHFKFSLNVVLFTGDGWRGIFHTNPIQYSTLYTAPWIQLKKGLGFGISAIRKTDMGINWWL